MCDFSKNKLSSDLLIPRFRNTDIIFQDPRADRDAPLPHRRGRALLESPQRFNDCRAASADELPADQVPRHAASGTEDCLLKRSAEALEVREERGPTERVLPHRSD